MEKILIKITAFDNLIEVTPQLLYDIINLAFSENKSIHIQGVVIERHHAIRGIQIVQTEKPHRIVDNLPLHNQNN